MSNVSHADWKLCVAPMMAWTDRHCRAFHRLLTPHARLYTEMLSCDALLHGHRERLLTHTDNGHPLALQLGGSNPAALARCTQLGIAAGYDEVNLNVGCPSERVQRGAIGAVLMKSPVEVGDCVAAMADAAARPVTVKCRIGVDDFDSEAHLIEFVGQVAGRGCNVFIVHARKALLRGLSPAQNRSVPPLDYPRVYRLKQHFPELIVVINGGVQGTSDALDHLQHVDGVMLGRSAYKDPWLLRELDATLFGSPSLTGRKAVLDEVIGYADRELTQGARLHDITRHLHGWFNGHPGARRFRRHLSEHAHNDGAGSDVLREAAALVGETTESRCSNG